jgi:hypothetical protein
MSESSSVFSNPEPLLATLARLFAMDGATREVAILANAEADIFDSSYDNWNGGTTGYTLSLEIPTWLYSQIANDIESCETNLMEKSKPILKVYQNQYLEKICISPSLTADNEWRNKAKNWLSGDGVTNQGRVRSDNIPSRTMDGLLFRSQPEIFLYIALKSSGVSFAPLPVFIRGGESYKRIEPDFFIVKDGIVIVVEVDGDTVHHETPAEAHARTTMLAYEGVHIERVKASECANQELANQYAKKLLLLIQKIKASR